MMLQRKIQSFLYKSDTLTSCMGFINDWSSTETIRCSLFLSPLFAGSKESQLSFGKPFEEHQWSNFAAITYLSIVILEKLREENVRFLRAPIWLLTQ